MTGFLVALVACVVYMAISFAVGSVFVFSKYSMYADLTTRREGAVLYVRAGERFVEPDDLAAVFGLDVPALDPRRVPCSQQWVVYEAQRWFEQHAVPTAPEAGLPIEVGYRMLRVQDGAILEELRPVTRGVGRLR